MRCELSLIGAALAVACSSPTPRDGAKAERAATPQGTTAAEVRAAAPGIAPPPPLVRLSVGMHHACALPADGQLYCWGDNSVRQLGVGSDSEVVLEPMPVVGERRFRDVAVGNGVTCALDREGQAFCWGWGEDGELGAGALVDSAASPAAVAATHRFMSVVASVRSVCALDADGAAWCWGRHGVDPAAPPALRPARVAEALRFQSIAAKPGDYCGVATDGRAYCWGLNTYGRLGDGTTTFRSTPVPVASLEHVAAITLGEDHVCALDGDGAAWCWGGNRLGQLGAGKTAEALAQSATPVRVAGARRYRAIAAHGTSAHTCALDEQGAAWCWGNNHDGALGATTNEQCAIGVTGQSLPCATAPVAVGGGLRFTAISVGSGESCGATVEGRVFCWGVPDYLETPPPGEGSTPRAVALPEPARTRP